MTHPGTRRSRRFSPVLFATAAVAVATLGAWTATTIATTNASSAQSGAPSNFATIKLQRVLSELEAREQMEADLQILLGSLQSELNELNTQRENAVTDLEMLDEGTRAYQSKVIKIRELEGLLQYRRNLYDQQILIEKGRILRELYDTIADAAQRVAEREGYELVLIDDSTLALPQGDVAENNMMQIILGRRVMVNNSSHDISSLVIQLMNSQSGSARP